MTSKQWLQPTVQDYPHVKIKTEKGNCRGLQFVLLRLKDKPYNGVELWYQYATKSEKTQQILLSENQTYCMGASYFSRLASF